MSGTRTCQACGLENPADQDFCSCGEYLRWEPTNYQQAITPEMAAAAAAGSPPAAQPAPATPAASAPPATPPGAPPAAAPPSAAPPAAAPPAATPASHSFTPPLGPPGGNGAPANGGGNGVHAAPPAAPPQHQSATPPAPSGPPPLQQPHQPQPAAAPQPQPAAAPQPQPAAAPQPQPAPQAYQQPAPPAAPPGNGGASAYQTFQAPPPPVPVTPPAAATPPVLVTPPAPAPPAAHQGPAGTAVQRAAAQPPAARAPSHAPPTQPAEPDLISMLLRSSDETAQPPEPGEPLKFAIEPGGYTTIKLKVRNQSKVVDNYDIGIRGLPDEWYTIIPATVYLVPFGSAGAYEQEVTINLTVPRAPESESRFWDFEVTAHSKAHEREAGAVPGSMFVHPYEDFDAKIKPERRTARRRASYTAEIENKANAEQVIWLSASDPDLSLRYEFEPEFVKLSPGQKAVTELTVRPHKKILMGHPREKRFELGTHMGTADQAPEEVLEMVENSKKRGRGHPFSKKGLARLKEKSGVAGPRLNKGYMNIGPSGPQFQGPSMYKGHVSGKQVNFDQLKMPGFKRQAQTGLPAGPLTPRQAAFNQKSILPWWLMTIIPILIIIGIIIWLLWPRQVVVPDVRKSADVRGAEKTLKDDELRLEKVDKKVVTDQAQVGKILDQAPSPGKKVDKQTGVTVIIGVGNGKVPVPDLKGKTVPEAEKILREGKLTLGAVKPTDEDQEAVVRTQLPLKDELVREGSTVGINVVKPKEKSNAAGGGDEKKDEEEAAAAAGGGGGENSPGGGDIVVPPFVAGTTETESYAGLVGDEGLIPNVIKVFDKAKEGTVIRTVPGPGTPGKAEQVVDVFVSAGIPIIAYDDTEDVKRLDGADGKPLPAVAKTGDDEENPTWSPDGDKLVFTQEDRLFVQDMTDLEKAAVPLTAEGKKYDIPSFAPSVEDEIVAATRRTDAPKGSTGPPFDGDLCFAKLNGFKRVTPECVEDKDFTLYGHISWAPDGKSLLVTGTDATDAGRFGLIRYESQKAFSANPADWGKGKFVTSDEEPNQGCIWGDFSPDGKKLAMSCNTKGGQFRLYLAAPDDFALEKPVETPLSGACELGWRPDSLELAVVVKDPTSCGSSPGTSLIGPITTVKVNDTEDGFTVDATTARNIENAARHPSYRPGNLGKPAEDDAAAAPAGSGGAAAATPTATP